MGTWGVGIFSDDLAADLRGDFRDLIGEGMTPGQAVDKLLSEYASSVHDDEEMPVFWLALAASQWQLGRLEGRTRENAIRLIESGQDLVRWERPKDREKRAALLSQLRERLLSPPPPPKRVPRGLKSANNWAVGQIIAFRLASGNLTLMRVIGHHSDKGGRSAVCELLDWVGDSVPPPEAISRLSVRREAAPRGISQFLFQEPRKKKDQTRVMPSGFCSRPAQRPGGYAVFVWAYVDRLMKEIFGRE